jgi:hypothetical protein
MSSGKHKVKLTLRSFVAMVRNVGVTDPGTG